MPSRRSELANRAVGEPLPALARVRRGPPGRDGQHRVEEQDAALGPRRQIAGGRPGDAEVGLELGVDVLQRRGGRTPAGAEKQSPIA